MSFVLNKEPLDWSGENNEVGTITVPIHLQWLEGRKKNKFMVGVGGGSVLEDGVAVASFKNGVNGGTELMLDGISVAVNVTDLALAMHELEKSLKAKADIERKERQLNGIK
jgi:hypothetical protein